MARRYDEPATAIAEPELRSQERDRGQREYDNGDDYRPPEVIGQSPPDAFHGCVRPRRLISACACT